MLYKHSLEEILLLVYVVSKERDGVGHHPDVASPAVVVRLVPLPVLITHGQNLFLIHLEECVIDDPLVET